MATIKKPRGRMTKPLAMPFAVDVVLCTRFSGERHYVPLKYEITDLGERQYRLQVWLPGADIRAPGHSVSVFGDVGVTRRFFVSDPDDADAFLMFDVKWSYGRRRVRDRVDGEGRRAAQAATRGA
jgi:hypothetical protein